MLSQTDTKTVKLFIFLSFLVFLAGCATERDYDMGSSGRKPARVYMRQPEVESRAHPAAYLVDRFAVPKKIQKPVESPVPFYFKTCDRHIGDFMTTNSRYDCDYP